VEQSADRHSICTNTLYFQESAQDSFVFTVVFWTLSFINLIRVAYVVRRPCSDFTEMLRHLINCHIIIIFIIINLAYDHMLAKWLAQLTASTFNPLGQYVSSPDSRTYCYKELAISSLAFTVTVVIIIIIN